MKLSKHALPPRGLQFRRILLALSPFVTACAPSPAPHTINSCVPPAVTPCPPPPRPTTMETEAELLAAYIDALSAWAVCRAEVEKIRNYYLLLEEQ